MRAFMGENEFIPDIIRNFSLTISNGIPYLAFAGKEVYGNYVNIYVFYFDGTSWVEIKRDNICAYPQFSSCYYASTGGLGLLSRDGNLYLLWNGNNLIFVERYNGFKWEFLPEPPPGWGIYRDYPEIDNAAIFLTNEGFPGVVYSQSRTRLFMDIWDGFNWVPIDGQISEGAYPAGVTTHTKSVIVSPDGSIYVGYAEQLPSVGYLPQGRVLIKRYDVSTGSWVDEYEALYNGTESPSLAKYDGYIYMAEAGGKWELICQNSSLCYWRMVHRIYVKRAELPLGRAQFEECFARVVSSRDALENLRNKKCLVDNMVFYNGFLYDVLKDPSRTLRERVFAGAYLFEFPQYLNSERISYLNSSEFVSLLNDALFREEDEYIKEKATFSLVREENDYAKTLITDVLSDERRIGLFYILKRHSTGSKSRWLGELLFDLAFFHPYPYTKWNAKRILSMIDTSAVPFEGFINIFSKNYELDMKAEALQSLHEVLLYRKKSEISEDIRKALGDSILPLKNYPELRGYVMKVLSALGGYWEFLVDELKNGEYTWALLPAMSTAIELTTKEDFYQKIDELVDIALNPEIEDWRRIYAAQAGFHTVIRNVEPMALIPLWDVYPYAVSLIFDESVPLFVKTEALQFSTSVTDEVSRSELLMSVISSTTDYTILSEAIRLGALADCSFVASFTDVKNDYSSELSLIGFYKGKIKKEILKLEEKLKRKLSVNEDCPKGCKGKNCINCVGIAGKIDQIISKIDEAKRYISEPGIIDSIDKFKRDAIDFKERVLADYSFLSENGYISLNPSNYRNEINRLKSFVLSLRDELYDIMRIVSNKDALDKLNEVEEKLSEVDEKIDEMYEGVSEAEDEVKEILKVSPYFSVSDMTSRENLLTSLSMQIDVTTSTLMERCDPATVQIQEYKGSESIEKEGNPDDPPVISGYVLNQDGEKLKGVTLEFRAGGYCTQWSIPECANVQWVQFWLDLWNLWQPRTVIGLIIKIVFFWWVRLLAVLVCNASCENYVPGVTYTAQTDDEGVYTVELTSSFINYHVYLKEATYPYLATGTHIASIYVSSDRTIHFVIPFAETTTQCADKDGDHINDCAEALLANNHNPNFNFAGDGTDGGERYFPRHPKLYYNCAEDEGCNVNQEGKIKCGNSPPVSPKYEEIFKTIGSGDNCRIQNTGNKIRIMRTSGHVYYHVRKPNESTFHIQYYLFFDYNDPETLYGWDDHYADWEWLCVYTNAEVNAYYDTYPDHIGKIWKLHYHHHGVTPSKDAGSCGDWEDVRFIRYAPDSEWNERNTCKINGQEYHIDYCYLYNPNVVPEKPRVWIGDDVHGFWDGYPEVPRTACSNPWDFNESIDNYPARLPDNSPIHTFPYLISITPSSSPSVDYDQTVHMYMGKWGSDDKSPRGPFGSDESRDFDGRYDEN